MAALHSVAGSAFVEPSPRELVERPQWPRDGVAVEVSLRDTPPPHRARGSPGDGGGALDEAAAGDEEDDEEARAGGGAGDDDDDDSDGEDDSEGEGGAELGRGPGGSAGGSALHVWAQLAGRVALAALALVASVLLFVLYPLYALCPQCLLNACGRCTFRLGYIVYTTRVGGWLHARSLRSAAASGQPGRRHSTPPPPLVTSTAVVYTVPILESNYTYLLVDSATRLAAAVDPADPAAVLAAAASVGCELAAILTTHGHHDHAGGNAALCDAVRGRTGRALLVAGAGPGRCCGGGRGGGGVERVPRLNRPVADGDVLQLGATRVRAVATPCHTRGSVAYEVLGPGDGGGAAEAVFSGDTVFIGGVGAFFHGSAADMAACVAKLDARVPPGGACALLCGHEYAADNLRFAAWVEPRNDEVVAAYCAAAAARQAGRATVPGTVGAERLTNPYFRAASPRLQRAVAHRLARGGGAGAGPPAARPSPATRLVAAALAPLRRASPPPQPSQQPQPPGENGAPAPALPPPLPAAEVYARLQMLLASGEWQHFRVTEARRARALAAVAVHRAAQQLATGLAAAGAGAGGRGGATTQLSPPPAQQAPR